MGVYYSSISKRTRMVEGVEIAYSNFYGKAPPYYVDNSKSWNSFCTRAFNTARAMKDKVKYVMYGDAKTLSKYGEAELAEWNGTDLLHDGFWDAKRIGKVKRGPNGRYYIEKDKVDER